MIISAGEGTQVWASGCTFKQNVKSGVFVGGSGANPKRTRFDPRYTGNGAEPARFKASHCRFIGNEGLNVAVSGVSNAALTKCVVNGSRKSSGLVRQKSTQ